MVDVFRASQYAPAIVDEALALDPKPQVIWMQLGRGVTRRGARQSRSGRNQGRDESLPKIEYGRLSSEISWIGVNSRTLSSKRAPLLGKGVQRMSLNRQTMSGGTTDATNRAERDKDGGDIAYSENRMYFAVGISSCLPGDL
jgi:hypothetical protein